MRGITVGTKLRIVSLTLCLFCTSLTTRSAPAAKAINTAEFDAEVQNFLGKELTAHLLAISSLTPPPDKVLNVPTTGEFSWGTFMRSLAAYSESTGTRELGGRDIAKWVGQIGLIESRAGSKAFSQLYAALALRHFGKDLKTNPLWQSLSPEEQTAWRSLLNPERFYDPKTNRVINLPDNYLGVASRIASVSFELGISTDRAFLDRLLDRAAIQFTTGHLYADDSPPTGRYDRYSNEYARYIFEAAEIAGRKDLLDKVRPSLNVQMRLWWDLVSEDGYGYNWGRSQGVVSYLDTPEIVGFLADHKEFRPAPLAELAALYYQSWNYLHHDYNVDTHLLSLFAFGRGNYGYITKEREWQQTTGFFGKLANSHSKVIKALKGETVASFPAVPTLAEVNRFEFFRKAPEREAGVWVVRQGPLRFALPITTGPKPGLSDYLPAPHGLPGFAAPVEQVYPVMVPFIELGDGRTVVATDGADSIVPATNGKTLKATWTKWALLGTPSGALVDVGLKSEVTWRIEGASIMRQETLSSSSNVSIKSWKLAVPSSYDELSTQTSGDAREDVFSSTAGTLGVQFSKSNFPYTTLINATGNSALGKGVHGGIPLYVVFEAKDLNVQNGKPLTYQLSLSVTKRCDCE